jgi:hypothetical protein
MTEEQLTVLAKGYMPQHQHVLVVPAYCNVRLSKQNNGSSSTNVYKPQPLSALLEFIAITAKGWQTEITSWFAYLLPHARSY